MNRLLRTDCYRMFCKKRFWLSVISMLFLAVAFILMQYTAMDYVVPLSRVIFLPMSFYGVVSAALVSLFVAEDFSDGVIRNKLIAGRTRGNVYLSNLFVSLLACIVLYTLTTATTTGIALHLFETDVTPGKMFEFFFLGILMCLAYASIYSMVTMLLQEKAVSVVVCMGLSFIMLFLSLHTNQILVQPEFKDGLPNPHFADGIRRIIYGILHDLNPTGQAAQLSTMEYYDLMRWICLDLCWVIVSAGLGNLLFYKKDIK